MRKIVLLTVLLAGVLFAGGGKYFVFFADKGEGEKSEWRQRAAQSLSPRALERRQRMGIPLDWYDLPVCENYVRQIEALGAQVVHRSKWLNAVSVRCADTLVSAIRSLPFVVRVRPVRVFVEKLPQIHRLYRPAVEDSFYGAAYQQAEM
ncbi:MAG TPA: hypothetical protein ENG11_06035, partial [candidate division Zixibacteria bacterium]|nr:hypothetical protein [candidate division Zixibacteria bacterium]